MNVDFYPHTTQSGLLHQNVLQIFGKREIDFRSRDRFFFTVWSESTSLCWEGNLWSQVRRNGDTEEQWCSVWTLLLVDNREKSSLLPLWCPISSLWSESWERVLYWRSLKVCSTFEMFAIGSDLSSRRWFSQKCSVTPARCVVCTILWDMCKHMRFMWWLRWDTSVSRLHTYTQTRPFRVPIVHTCKVNVDHPLK